MIEETNVLDKYRDNVSREILDAYQIAILRENCVSAPSIDLHGNGLRFLQARLAL